MIIRHAEKPAVGRDLTDKGRQRAKAYAGYFKKWAIDSKPLKPDYLVAAADSDSSERSRLTLEPLSKALGMKLDLRFTAQQGRELAEDLRSTSHGQCVLICWHHGKIPDLAKALGADPAKLLPNGLWPDEEYGWILVLRYDSGGRLIQARRINGISE